MRKVEHPAQRGWLLVIMTALCLSVLAAPTAASAQGNGHDPRCDLPAAPPSQGVYVVQKWSDGTYGRFANGETVTFDTLQTAQIYVVGVNNAVVWGASPIGHVSGPAFVDTCWQDNGGVLSSVSVADLRAQLLPSGGKLTVWNDDMQRWTDVSPRYVLVVIPECSGFLNDAACGFGRFLDRQVSSSSDVRQALIGSIPGSSSFWYDVVSDQQGAASSYDTAQNHMAANGGRWSVRLSLTPDDNSTSPLTVGKFGFLGCADPANTKDDQHPLRFAPTPATGQPPLGFMNCYMLPAELRALLRNL
ncbi:MAG TPA: hypothetical protein VII56_17600 [Rhizomicrobium sp.]